MAVQINVWVQPGSEQDPSALMVIECEDCGVLGCAVTAFGWDPAWSGARELVLDHVSVHGRATADGRGSARRERRRHMRRLL
jgi:hypothetical protein